MTALKFSLDYYFFSILEREREKLLATTDLSILFFTISTSCWPTRESFKPHGDLHTRRLFQSSFSLMMPFVLSPRNREREREAERERERQRERIVLPS